MRVNPLIVFSESSDSMSLLVYISKVLIIWCLARELRFETQVKSYDKKGMHAF